MLRVEGLAKSFGDHTLFTDLDFEIKRGERVALIGNNGTGKTTILKIINELLAADAGSLRLEARCVSVIMIRNIMSFIWKRRCLKRFPMIIRH